MILVADTKSFEDFAKDMNRAIEPRVSTSEPICIPMGDLDFIFKLQNTEEPFFKTSHAYRFSANSLGWFYFNLSPICFRE